MKPAILVVATGAEKRGGKRGRGSENTTPLTTAVQVTDDTQQPVVLRLSLVAGCRKAKLERRAQEHLEPGTTVHSDGLACFSGVEAAGCRHEATVTGGGPGSCETAGLVWVNTTLGNVQRSMDGSYHAVGPKYLARYLAEPNSSTIWRPWQSGCCAPPRRRSRCHTRCWPPSPSAASRADAADRGKREAGQPAARPTISSAPVRPRASLPHAPSNR